MLPRSVTFQIFLFIKLLLSDVVDCSWESWGSWSNCTIPCGTGSRYSVRKIKQHAQGGGLPCTGNVKRTDTCNTQSCPCNAIVQGFIIRIYTNIVGFLC